MSQTTVITDAVSPSIIYLIEEYKEETSKWSETVHTKLKREEVESTPSFQPTLPDSNPASDALQKGDRIELYHRSNCTWTIHTVVKPSPLVLKPPNYLPDPIWRFPHGGLHGRRIPVTNETVEVYWEEERRFFKGLVEWTVGERGWVVYEDGDEEEVDWGRNWWRKVVGDEELVEVGEGEEEKAVKKEAKTEEKKPSKNDKKETKKAAKPTINNTKVTPASLSSSSNAKKRKPKATEPEDLDDDDSSESTTTTNTPPPNNKTSRKAIRQSYTPAPAPPPTTTSSPPPKIPFRRTKTTMGTKSPKKIHKGPSILARFKQYIGHAK
ncbi:hypothetical protein TrLO_g15287 [Triparma laevis f. longispina]|uniref:Uncharacterized protein n=1 Tax=Triparma laevis f. longispina TaxID=1714387 RepID=A0A9W7FCY5_9STRA|nr:hypothetical protein TrLO_g15287 [Triparma laevis f. longispina]